MIKKTNSHIFQIIVATIFVLIFGFCSVGLADSDTDAVKAEIDPYVVYMEKYESWCFRIEDQIEEERAYRVYSPRAEELVDNCDIHLFESDRISITVQQTLVDSAFGYVNLCFTSDQYILRPADCLNVYAPFYQPGNAYTQPVCFIEIKQIMNHLSIYSQAEGLSEKQKQFNLIALCSFHSDGDASITKCDVRMKLKLHFFNSGEEDIETIDVVFPINVLENIDECHLMEPMIHEEFNLITRDISMVITPLRLVITPVGRESLYRAADYKYYWTLADQKDRLIFAFHNGEDGVYLSSIPDPIYYVIFEYDENGKEQIVFRQQLVRQGNAWIVQ